MAWSAVTNTRKDCKRQGPSLWIGWQGSFCVSLLWCSTWGVWGLISPSGGQKMKPAEPYYSGPTQYPVGYLKATSVMTGSHRWPWSCLRFHQRRPDFRWDTLFLSQLKRALHVFSPVFHNPRNASAAWINHLQIVSRLFPSARSRELETISRLWLLPLWVMGSCGSWGHVRQLENYAAHGIKWSTEPSDWVDWAHCPFGAILSIASWALELKIFKSILKSIGRGLWLKFLNFPLGRLMALVEQNYSETKQTHTFWIFVFFLKSLLYLWLHSHSPPILKGCQRQDI